MRSAVPYSAGPYAYRTFRDGHHHRHPSFLTALTRAGFKARPRTVLSLAFDARLIGRGGRGGCVECREGPAAARVVTFSMRVHSFEGQSRRRSALI